MKKNTTSWLKVGTRCRWHDPAIEDYQPEERQAILDRVFTITRIRGEIVLVSDGTTEAEVLAHELEQVTNDCCTF